MKQYRIYFVYDNNNIAVVPLSEGVIASSPEQAITFAVLAPARFSIGARYFVRELYASEGVLFRIGADGVLEAL